MQEMFGSLARPGRDRPPRPPELVGRLRLPTGGAGWTAGRRCSRRRRPCAFHAPIRLEEPRQHATGRHARDGARAHASAVDGI